MSKEKTLNVEHNSSKEAPKMTDQQLQQVMRHDMDMIRLRASVLELKAIKWKMIKEMLETEINKKPVINKELGEKLKEDMTSLAESILTISA